MNSDYTEVKALLEILSDRISLDNSDRYLKLQALSALLSLQLNKEGYDLNKYIISDLGHTHKENSITHIVNKIIHQLIPGTEDPNKKVANFYFDIITKQQKKGNVFDLHGMDHLSVKLLLKNLGQSYFRPVSIIVGKATHSKHSRNVLRELVQTACDERYFNYRIDRDNSGEINISYEDPSCVSTF